MPPQHKPEHKERYAPCSRCCDVARTRHDVMGALWWGGTWHVTPRWRLPLGKQCQPTARPTTSEHATLQSTTPASAPQGPQRTRASVGLQR